MYGLPRGTELNRPLPKKSIFDKFQMNTTDRAKFDADIRKLVIVAEVSPLTVNIPADKNVPAFYVVQVNLKTTEYADKTIVQLSKLIDQKLLFVLEYVDRARLAVYHKKLIQSDWCPVDEINITLSGLSLNTVWGNIILSIGGIHLEQDKTLDEQLVLNDEREKLRWQIEKLEKHARREKQPRRKFELAQDAAMLKNKLGGI